MKHTPKEKARIEDLIKRWERRRDALAEEIPAHEGMANYKLQHKFMTIRDCIKELKQVIAMTEPVLSCCGDDMTGLDVPICPTCKEWQ